MPGSRPLLRPAVVLERSLLGARGAGGFAVARSAAYAVRDWKRLGYVCIAISVEPGAVDELTRARSEVALQREIEGALRGFGGGLDGSYAAPRAGEQVDPDVPRASVFARLLLEAATKHRIDLPRSFLVAASLDAVAGARFAGMPSVLVAAPDDPRCAEAQANPQARPDHVLPDLGAVHALVGAQRARGASQGT